MTVCWMRSARLICNIRIHGFYLVCCYELDPQYKNAYKRLEVLEQQYQFEMNSVLFYLTAYQCYKEKPTLLKKLGKFEVQVLNFATKYRLLTREVALYVANFASQQKYFNDRVPDPGTDLQYV